MQESDERYASREALEEQNRQLVNLLTTAQQNEIYLHRRLSPYLDAELENRDAEIEELQARTAELEANERKMETGEEPEDGI